MLLVVYADFVSGYELSFSIFYLMPVLFVTWGLGHGAGVGFSFLASAAWAAADHLSGQIYSHPAIVYWNASVRLGFFLLCAWFLSQLHTAWKREKDFARIDFRTGVANSRFFQEMAVVELSRSHRHESPITIAYVDLDNFKQVNDQFGHAAGDRLLHAVAQTIRKNVRATDLVARLGGDEFSILFPELNSTATLPLLGKIQKRLLKQMQENDWPVTFSMGAVTFATAPDSLEVMIKEADALMYEVKKAGKNAIKHAIRDSRQR